MILKELISKPIGIAIIAEIAKANKILAVLAKMSPRNSGDCNILIAAMATLSGDGKNS